MKRLLRGGRVVDPANGVDGTFDVLIDGDRIARVGRDLPVDADVTVIDVPAVREGQLLEVVMDADHDMALGYLRYYE